MKQTAYFVRQQVFYWEAELSRWQAGSLHVMYKDCARDM